MKLLLDTHIWVWSVAEPERLSSRVRNALESPENEIWLSPISIWEYDIAQESRVLDLPQEDSADRFLAATAKVLELTLVTADGRLAGSREFAVLPN